MEAIIKLHTACTCYIRGHLNRFINVILEVFNVFKENDFKYPELFVLGSSVIKKEKLQNILAPQVYHKWVEVIEKITDQWWNSETLKILVRRD